MTAYVVSVYIHILAAAVWIGGIAFLVLVIVPALRRADHATALPFLRATVMRFRTVGWCAFAVLFVTGLFNLHARAVTWAQLSNPAWRATDFARSLLWKLSLFAGIVVLQALHDFWIGPLALRELEAAPDGPRAQRLRKLTGWIGRIVGLATLAIALLAVTLVRGCP